MARNAAAREGREAAEAAWSSAANEHRSPTAEGEPDHAGDLIEDDPWMRGLIADALGEGVEVDGLASAEDALILLGAGRVSGVLVADVNLRRGPSGRDLAQIARERHPGVEVVLISGAPPPALHPLRRERFLRKPFAPEALAAAIRSAAAASSPQSP